MYVTAQRVRNESGHEGVHLFVFVHGEGTVPGLDWTSPDAGFVAEVHPGQLLLTARAIDGERLAVRSYLDIAFHNSLAKSSAWLLRRLVAAWPGGHSWPMSWSKDGIGARFYVVSSMREDSAVELNELHAALLPILGDAVPRRLGEAAFQAPVAQALVIRRRRTDRGVEFRLEENSRRTLESLGAPPRRSVVSVSLENYDDFKVLIERAIEEEVIPLVTDLSMEQVVALGGAEVVDEKTGERLWPAAS